MCYVIVVCLPSKADLEKARAAPRAPLDFGSSLDVPEGAPPGELYIRATKLHCDCGTRLGSANPGKRKDDRTRYLQDVRRWQRKGWSRGKIHGWLDTQLGPEQARVAPTPEARVNEYFDHPPPPDVDEELEAWCEAIQGVLDRGVRHVGLILQWWTGANAPALRELRTARAAELNASFLRELEQDVLYRFVATR